MCLMTSSANLQCVSYQHIHSRLSDLAYHIILGSQFEFVREHRDLFAQSFFESCFGSKSIGRAIVGWMALFKVTSQWMSLVDL